MIMAFDPEILFNDGIYDVFEVTLPGGLAAEPEVPGAALEPAERPHAPLRLHERRARPEGPGAVDGRGVRDEPVLRLLGERRRRASTSSSSSSSSAGSPPDTRRTASTGIRGGRSSGRPRRSTPRATTRCASSELRPDRDTGGAGFHRGGTGIEKTYVFTGPGSFTVNDDRATIPPWGINGGRHGGCSTKTLIRVTGDVVELPSKIDQVPVAAGDTLVFRTAGAGGWGDPLERDPALVLRDVLRDLVSHQVALDDYGVVIGGNAVDEAATEAERARLGDARGPVEPFDFGHAPTGGLRMTTQPALPPRRARRDRRARRARRPHRPDRRAVGHRGALPRRLRGRRAPLRPARRRPRRPRRGRRERAPDARGDRAFRSSSTPTRATAPRRASG